MGWPSPRAPNNAAAGQDWDSAVLLYSGCESSSCAERKEWRGGDPRLLDSAAPTQWMEWQGVRTGEPRLILGLVLIDERDHPCVYLVCQRTVCVKQRDSQVGISMQLLALRFAFVVCIQLVEHSANVLLLEHIVANPHFPYSHTGPATNRSRIASRHHEAASRNRARPLGLGIRSLVQLIRSQARLPPNPRISSRIICPISDSVSGASYGASNSAGPVSDSKIPNPELFSAIRREQSLSSTRPLGCCCLPPGCPAASWRIGSALRRRVRLPWKPSP